MSTNRQDSREKDDSTQVPTDAELVKSVRAGKLDGFDQLVRRYQKKATAVAYRLLTNRDDALEVAQDAFLKAYDRLDSLTEPERFGGWLLRIVNNLALNKRRSRALRKTAQLEMTDSDSQERVNINRADTKTPTPFEHAAGNDLQEMLNKAIETLPDLQRQALLMFSVEKIPQKQVAEVLGCSVEAVKWHVFTARKKLKDMLGGYLQ